MNRKVRGENIILKLDMRKAYDRVNWGYLLEVLKQFGFSEQWRNLIFNCISFPWFSIT